MSQKDEVILIIDDEANMREMLAQFLRSQGFDVQMASNGQEGFEKFLSLSPDLTISDMKMPVMDGMEFLQAAIAQRPQATIIMLTAFATLDTAVRALKLGAYDYLTKPIDDLVNDFLVKVELGLERSRLVKENEDLNTRLKKANKVLKKRQRKLDAELVMGGVVQQSLLPVGQDQLAGLDYGFRRVVAEHISGDFYDIAQLSEGRFGMMIGQVFGRDVPAALLMAMISGTIRELQHRFSDPLIVLNKANDVIRRYLEQGYKNFVTAFYAVVDLPEHVIRFASAAHPAPILMHYRQDGSIAKTLTGKGHYLGKYKSADLALNEHKFLRGDLILFYTENVVNVQNAKGDTFGVKRLIMLLEQHENSSIEVVLDSIMDKLKSFDVNSLKDTDLALTAIRYGRMSRI